MFGSHLSIAGGMHKALLAAEELGLQTVQVFTKNQQQWKVPPLSASCLDQWQQHRNRLRFDQTVSHASYLINLASPDQVLWEKSIDLIAEELSRCEVLAIPHLVMHPGAHMGAGDEAGLERIVMALDRLYDGDRFNKVTTCLESTAGQGTTLGHQLEHLAWIIEHARRPERLGVCLDTAHLFAAGYDFRGEKYDAFRCELERLIGIEHVGVWHLNDSKKDLGTRVDRHHHIGEGFIGLSGFQGIVRDPAFAEVPKILETPKGKADDGRSWDTINLERLHALL